MHKKSIHTKEAKRIVTCSPTLNLNKQVNLATRKILSKEGDNDSDVSNKSKNQISGMYFQVMRRKTKISGSHSRPPVDDFEAQEGVDVPGSAQGMMVLGSKWKQIRDVIPVT